MWFRGGTEPEVEKFPYQATWVSSEEPEGHQTGECLVTLCASPTTGVSTTVFGYLFAMGKHRATGRSPLRPQPLAVIAGGVAFAAHLVFILNPLVIAAVLTILCFVAIQDGESEP